MHAWAAVVGGDAQRRRERGETCVGAHNSRVVGVVCVEDAWLGDRESSGKGARRGERGEGGNETR